MSLIAGPLPTILSFAALVALGAAIRWRDKRSVLLEVLLFFGCLAVLISAGTALNLPAMFGARFPRSFYIWAALPIFAVSAATLNWRVLRPSRRALAIAAAPLLMLFGVVQINSHYGYVPTMADLFQQPLPGEVSARLLLVQIGAQNSGHAAGLHAGPTSALFDEDTSPSRARPKAGRDPLGRVASMAIPANVSHFRARRGWVWLPPAWTRASAATFPVLIFVSGTPGGPADWLRAGGALDIANRWAAHHNGAAPIMIFPDINGSFTGDTECVDGPRGRAETYLTVDVPRFISSTFAAPAPPSGWVIIGLSEGATCAVHLALGHPDLFSGFASFSPDAAPNLGSPAHTLDKLFGGSTRDRDAHDPTTLFARRYREFAWFDAGSDDPHRRAAAIALAARAEHAGLDVHLRIRAGGHNFHVWRRALRDAYPWLLGHLEPPKINRGGRSSH